MARLPTPGSDDGQWGDILNEYLGVEHNADGTQKDLPQSKITNLTNDLAAKIDKATLDANSVLGAVADNTPIPVPVPASRVVGRKASGDITALTGAEVAELIPGGTYVDNPTPGTARTAVVTDDVAQVKAGRMDFTGDVVFASGRPWVDLGGFPGIDLTGAADSRAAIQAGLAVVPGGPVPILASRGTYKVSRYVPASGYTDLWIAGHAAKFTHPSADPAVVDDATTQSTTEARSAFLVTGGSRVTFEGLVWQGDAGETDITVNVGKAVYARTTSHLRMLFCTSLFGGGLITQDANATDIGARILACVKYGFRTSTNLGHDSIFAFNHCEQPADAGYNRSGNNGSSHGVYIYAGRNNVLVPFNNFKRVRVDALKVSGTSLPIRNFLAMGNTMELCANGGTYGDDTGANPEHVNLLLSHSAMWDCDAGFTVLGSKNAALKDNFVYYDRDHPNIASAPKAFGITRYTATASPVEQMAILNNMLYGYIAPGKGTGAAAILTRGITADKVGEGCRDGKPSCIRIDGNMLDSVCGTGVETYRCTGPLIERQVFTNIVTAAQISGRMPVFRFNHLLVGPQTSNNAQLRLLNAAWPTIYGNTTGGKTGHGQIAAGKAAGAWTISDNNAGSTAVDFPLLGASGKAMPTMGQPEVVYAYGDPAAWLQQTGTGTVSAGGTVVSGLSTVLLDALQKFGTIRPHQEIRITGAGTGGAVHKANIASVDVVNGTITMSTAAALGVTNAAVNIHDRVALGGSTVGVYATTPGAGEFNTAAGLVTLINAFSGGIWVATDYGSDYSPAVVTHHYRLRRTTATASGFSLTMACGHMTAGTILSNGTGSAQYNVDSRGGDASSPGNKMVIWSPLAFMHSFIQLVPVNASARTLLSGTANLSTGAITGGYFVTVASADNGACAVVEFAGVPDGTEVFRWSIAS